MTVKRSKKNSGFPGGRAATIAFSLCLLAAVAMIGMYTVGRTDQKQKELEQQVAEAEEARALEEKRQKEFEEARQEAASAAAKRQKDAEEQKEKEQAEADGPELESEFAEAEIADMTVEEDVQERAEISETVEEPTLSFSPDTDKLMWPVAGNIILDYSMDKSVYFTTLDQYKYNPAVIIQGSLDESVMSAAQGKIASIGTTEETGTTVTLEIGNGYSVIYGQLKELAVKEGDYVKAGETIGYVSEPTRFYSKEGCNVYMEVQKDGESVDPMTLLQ